MLTCTGPAPFPETERAKLPKSKLAMFSGRSACGTAKPELLLVDFLRDADHAKMRTNKYGDRHERLQTNLALHVTSQGDFANYLRN